MRNNVILLLSIVLGFCPFAFSETADEENVIKDSRVRFFLGLSTIESNERYWHNSIYLLLNINFKRTRGIGFNVANETPLCIGTEWGLNYYLPYLKVGPEIRFNKKFYIGSHAGVAVLFVPPMMIEPDFFIVLWGMNAGTIINMSKRNSAEIELGFDSFNGIIVPNIKFGIVLR